MSDVTWMLLAIEQGDQQASEDQLPLVYQELRKLAADKLSREKPGQTLQATLLVHEAYLRLVETDQQQQWNGRGHFFGAAAEAMRRILVESARRKCAQKHGRQLQHPGIAPVYELGHFKDRRPFFSMKLVKRSDAVEASGRS